MKNKYILHCTISTMACTAITKKGIPCTRLHKSGIEFCGIHAKCKDRQLEILNLTTVSNTIDDVLECAICCCGIPTKHQACSIPCNHIYHSTCVIKWFDMQMAKGQSPSCPTCRAIIPKTNSCVRIARGQAVSRNTETQLSLLLAAQHGATYRVRG